MNFVRPLRLSKGLYGCWKRPACLKLIDTIVILLTSPHSNYWHKLTIFWLSQSYNPTPWNWFSAPSILQNVRNKWWHYLRLKPSTKGLDLIVDYAPDLPLHRIGDSVRIQQIFSNLIANAIKFCDEGSIYIRLHTDKQLAVIIEVQDTGIGIPEEAKNQLFNAFSQADTSISRLYGGTGLGLSILKNLVDLMGGQVNLESTVGKGSTFQINLPLPPR